jgi:nitrate/TMAO reductase-like tetraheme cytochrome c subunit
MLANDSRECRNCHSYHAMDFENQSRRAREKMREGIEEGKTCIECHKGIAHKLPKDPNADEDERDD